MQRHNIRTSESTVKIRQKKIRQRKSPFSRSYCDEKIREGTEPYIAAETTNMIIQVFVSQLAKAPVHHDTQKVGQGIAYDFLVP